jgi:hypothetical protein
MKAGLDPGEAETFATTEADGGLRRRREKG